MQARIKTMTENVKKGSDDAEKESFKDTETKMMNVLESSLKNVVYQLKQSKKSKDSEVEEKAEEKVDAKEE